MTDSHESPLTIGRVVAGRYEVTRVLSRSRSGTVYHALEVGGDEGQQAVALKVIHPALCRSRQIAGRFRREARILKRLDSPHVARMVDFVGEDDLLIIVLELVDGPSLRTYLESAGPLDAVEAVGIAEQLCTALAAAHEADVIHRDLKPSNVLLEGASLPGYDSRSPAELDDSRRAVPLVKVVDFGLAKILQGDDARTALTEHDMIFGTPDYMSPEQVQGDDLDQRCDLYALGAILFEMLVGHVPFATAGALTTMSAHLEQPVPSPRSEAPDRAIPAALDRVVVRALAKDREERFDSAQAFAAALTAALSEEPAGLDDGEGQDRSEPLDEPGRLSNPIGTTLESHRITGFEAGAPRGAKVQVLVRDADPDSAEAPTRRIAEQARAARPIDGVPEPREMRMWAMAALVAALVAVAVGVWFGVR